MKGYAYEIVELDSGHTSVDSRDNLLSNGDGVDVVHV